MKYKIHFTKNKVEDSFEVEGDIMEEIIDKAMKETKRRNLTENENKLWSEEIK